MSQLFALNSHLFLAIYHEKKSNLLYSTMNPMSTKQLKHSNEVSSIIRQVFHYNRSFRWSSRSSQWMDWDDQWSWTCKWHIFVLSLSKRFESCHSRLRPNERATNRAINPPPKHLRPILFYVRPNVFQIFFKRLLKVVFRRRLQAQQQHLRQHLHIMNPAILRFNHIHQLIFHFIHVLVKVR